jgi:hypothetical protein
MRMHRTGWRSQALTKHGLPPGRVNWYAGWRGFAFL